MHKKIVKLKLLCECVECVIIITRRAAEKAIAKIAFSAFLSVKIIILSIGNCETRDARSQS